jgi:hypothetical protein
MEDLVTLGASSGVEGLSGITACQEGAAKKSGCISSSSLKARNRLHTSPKKKRSKKQIVELRETLTNP